MVAAQRPQRGCGADATTMKDKLYSLLRHAITAIPAAGAAMAANGWLTTDEGAKLDADLTTFLLSAAAILAGVLTRMLMALVAKHAPHLSNIFGGGSGASLPLWAMTCTAAAFSMAGGLSSCAVGVDSAGGWSIKPDPRTIDAGLKYLIRHEDDQGGSKAGLTQWEYYDPATGEKIPPEDYAAWGITASPAE